VINNDGTWLDNRESDIRMQCGVVPLPAQTGLDAENNAFLSAIVDEAEFTSQPEGAW
jgi:hypothetical protein